MFDADKHALSHQHAFSAAMTRERRDLAEQRLIREGKLEPPRAKARRQTVDDRRVLLVDDILRTRPGDVRAERRAHPHLSEYEAACNLAQRADPALFSLDADRGSYAPTPRLVGQVDQHDVSGDGGAARGKNLTPLPDDDVELEDDVDAQLSKLVDQYKSERGLDHNAAVDAVRKDHPKLAAAWQKAPPKQATSKPKAPPDSDNDNDDDVDLDDDRDVVKLIKRY